MALSLDLSGGVTAAALLDPSVGVLLRLGIACYIPVPLANVLIVSTALRANTSTPPTAVSLVGAADPVNTAMGKCAEIGQARRRALLSEATALNAPLLRRSLVDAAPPLLEVGLEVLSCVVITGGASDAGVSAASTALVARLAQLVNATAGGGDGSGSGDSGTGGSGSGGSGSGNTGGGSGTDGSGAVVSPIPGSGSALSGGFFGSFISHVANASGISAEGVGLFPSGPIAARAAPSSGSSGSGGGAFPTVLAVAAAAGGCVVCACAVVICVAWRRRQRRTEAASLRAQGKAEYEKQRLYGGTNPMQRPRGSAAMKAGLLPVGPLPKSGGAFDGANPMQRPRSGGPRAVPRTKLPTGQRGTSPSKAAAPATGALEMSSNPMMMMRKTGSGAPGAGGALPGGAALPVAGSNPMAMQREGRGGRDAGGGDFPGGAAALAVSGSNPMALQRGGRGKVSASAATPPPKSALLAFSSNPLARRMAASPRLPGALSPRRADGGRPPAHPHPGAAAASYVTNPMGLPRRAVSALPRSKKQPAAPAGSAAAAAAAKALGGGDSVEYSSNSLLLKRGGSVRTGISSTAAPSGGASSSASDHSWSRSRSDDGGHDEDGLVRSHSDRRVAVLIPSVTNPFAVGSSAAATAAHDGLAWSNPLHGGHGGPPSSSTSMGAGRGPRASVLVPGGAATARSQPEGMVSTIGGDGEFAWAQNPLAGPAHTAAPASDASPQQQRRVVRPSVVSVGSPFNAAPAALPSDRGLLGGPAGADEGAGLGEWAGSNPMMRRTGGMAAGDSDSDEQGNAGGGRSTRRRASGLEDELPTSSRPEVPGFAAGGQRMMWRSKRVLNTGKSTRRVASAGAARGPASLGVGEVDSSSAPGAESMAAQHSGETLQ